MRPLWAAEKQSSRMTNQITTEGTTMTNAIEQSKREMYLRQLEMLSDPYIDGIREKCYRLNDKKFRSYESAVESYLELLRQDHEALHETARKRFEDLQLAEASNKDLSEKIQYWRDLNANQRNSIEELQEAKEQSSEDIRKLEAVNRSLVRELAYVTEWRDNLIRDTSALAKEDRVSCEATDGQKAAIRSALADIRRISDDWALNGVRAKKSMLKISGILARPEVYAAMEAKTCQHSFHPCPLSRDDKSEVCVFCGAGK
jgi:exonuclease VII large subunit